MQLLDTSFILYKPYMDIIYCVTSFFQYTFDVTSESDTCMASLEQDDVVLGRQSGEGNNTIGFHVMKVIIKQHRQHEYNFKISASMVYMLLL